MKLTCADIYRLIELQNENVAGIAKFCDSLGRVSGDEFFRLMQVAPPLDKLSRELVRIAQALGIEAVYCALSGKISIKECS